MFKRLLFFVYGVVSYLVFLATFLYAIAFVGGFLVPRRLDGALETSLPAALAIDAGLLTVFAVQHSVMARRWFKAWWTGIVSETIERSTYVLCASLALLLLFWQWRPIGLVVWSVDEPLLRAVLWTLFAAGWGTVLVVTFLINHFDLFGLRQVWLSLVGKPYVPITFRTPLPYRYVRHPLYFGFLLAFWMTPTMTLAPSSLPWRPPPTSCWPSSSKSTISSISTAPPTSTIDAGCRCCCPAARAAASHQRLSVRLAGWSRPMSEKR